MRSSISNSNQRKPKIRYGMFWLGTVLLLAALIAGLDVLLRARGFEPSLSDDVVQWSIQRLAVEDCDDHTIVILGASRAHLGLSASTMQANVPGYKVIMLAVNGCRPLASLEDIAQHSNYRGIVLLSWHPHFDLFVSETIEGHVDYYRRQFANSGRYEKIANRTIMNWLQSNLRLFSDQARWKNLLQGDWHPYFITQDPTRSRKADFAHMSPYELDRRRKARLDKIAERLATGQYPNLPNIERELHRLRDATKTIQARGGSVILLRMPSSGPHLALENQVCPREKFWDRIAAETQATTIYWSDVAPLATFDTPDYSHLDGKDSPIFTKRLVDYLRATHWLN